MKSLLFVGIAYVIMIVTVEAQPWQKIKADFQSLPKAHRPAPLWFWNNTEVIPTEIKKQVTDLNRAGCLVTGGS